MNASKRGKGRARRGQVPDVIQIALCVTVVAMAAYNISVVMLSEEVPRFSRAAVSADGGVCAHIALDILKANGTAADAAIAGMFCSGVVNPHSMGLGGGFLLTYYSRREGRAYVLNARDAAPSAASEGMYRGKRSLVNGGLAVSVPGEVRGYWALYERFGGGVPWSDLLQPSIELCEDGTKVNWHLARALRKKRPNILAEPTLSMFVSNTTGDVLRKGDLLYQPALADTLRHLQCDPHALYTGTLATMFVEDLKRVGGLIEEQDLRNYSAEWVEPIKTEIKGADLTLYTVPPPGSGVILAFILKVMDLFNFNERSLDPENEVLTFQRLVETFKYAFAHRSYLGDPNFEDIYDLVHNLTSDAFAEATHDRICLDTTSQDPTHYGASSDVLEDHGTSHMAVLSEDGDAVSLTSTINTYFGALISSANTGIIYNNNMDDFSAPNIVNHFGLRPAPANYIKPGKRPMSSMSPSVLVSPSGEVKLVMGSAGGTRILTTLAQVFLHHCWLNRSLEEAVQGPRLHHQLLPMKIKWEHGFSQSTLQGLQALGHEMVSYPVKATMNAAAAIARNRDGSLSAVADRRKHGRALGY